MHTKIIETVSFKLVDGVKDTDFIETAGAVSTYLEGFQGFITRRLSKANDDTWLEHIEWDNMEEAKAASDGFMAQESLMPYMQAVDPESLKMDHQKLMLSFNN